MTLLARLAALGVAFSLVAAPPALAQSAEAQQLATRITHELFEAVGFEEAVRKGTEEALPKLGPISEVRPEWAKLAVDAIGEQVVQDRPLMEQLIGQRMAGEFTEAELRAGVVIFSDQQFLAAIKANQEGGPSPSGCNAECTKAMRSRDGRSFMRKLDRAMTDVFSEQAMSEVVAAIMPGFLRRFADKIEAAEKARPQVVK